MTTTNPITEVTRECDWLIGQRVTIVSGGEEHGWDEDRGCPEWISPDIEVTGTIDRVSPMLRHPTQIRVTLDVPTDWTGVEWTDIHSIVKIHTPYDDIPHTAEICTEADQHDE